MASMSSLEIYGRQYVLFIRVDELLRGCIDHLYQFFLVYSYAVPKTETVRKMSTSR
jgi:hypothetical protein